MSYCRSPFYIYPTGGGVQFPEGKFLDDDELDVFLYKLSLRQKELNNRIERGKKIMENYLKYMQNEENY